MKNLIKRSFIAVFALAIAFISTPLQAQGTFDITVMHQINGKALGADKELLVDIYVKLNGSELAVLEGVSFGTKYEDSLPAGSYEIVVTFAGTAEEVMSLGPVNISEGDNVKITATLGAGKEPTLRAVIR
jgi:hypothetical protein